MHVAHDARSHTHNRVRACRHTKYKHACIPCTYPYLHSSAQRNSTYHAQMCPTTTHSCVQATYCTHLSVWSMELWASAAAMCCAPSSPMELLSRLYAHVCVRAHVRTLRCTIPYIQPRARPYTSMHTCMPTCKIQTRVHTLHVYLMHNAIVHIMHKRAPLLRTHASRLRTALT
jgi:hypothetical protein